MNCFLPRPDDFGFVILPTFGNDPMDKQAVTKFQSCEFSLPVKFSYETFKLNSLTWSKIASFEMIKDSPSDILDILQCRDRHYPVNRPVSFATRIPRFECL